MFSLECENKLLVEDLLQQFFKEKIFEIITESLKCEVFDGSVPDLAQMLKVDANIYRDFNQEPLTNTLNGNIVFDTLTNEVLKMETTKSSANMNYWYKEYIKKLMTIKNLYGIVGVDRKTNEVINFTNPFRVASLLFTNRVVNIEAFYVYKKHKSIEFDTTNEKKETLNSMLDLLVTIYKKGLKHKKEILLNKYISLDKTKNNNENKKIYLYEENENSEIQTSFYSYLYFSDILLFNSFMPHYAVFNLKIKSGRLYNNYFKHLPMFSPNINIFHNCCTGNLPQLSKEGISCLKISNLSSPFFKEIFTKDMSYFVDINIAKAKEIYESHTKIIGESK